MIYLLHDKQYSLSNKTLYSTGGKHYEDTEGQQHKGKQQEG